MLEKVIYLLAANPYNIKANEIGLPTSTQSIGDGIGNIIKLIMSLIGMLSIVFILVGGLQLVYSTGDASRVKRGRETLIYAVIGLILSIGAFALVSFITNSVK